MKYIISIAAVIAAAFVLAQPAAVSAGIAQSVGVCLEVIIPSLFAFTVISIYLQSSGAYSIALAPLTKPLSGIMRLDRELCAVFILANIGGYPVGARLISVLVREGRLSQKDAGRLMCCCYGSGPSFVVAIAGIRIFGSAAAGGVLFAACFLSSLIIGIAVCRRGERIKLAPKPRDFDFSAGCFINSVTAGARVMFTVCVMIVAFSVVTAILDAAGAVTAMSCIFSFAGCNSRSIFPAILEISRVSAIKPISAPVMPLCGALLSFGGVCVILQVMAITAGTVPLKGFLISRIPAAGLSALFSLLGAFLPPVDVTVSADAAVKAQPFSVNAGMSVCVIVMCCMLLSMKKAGSE